MLHCLSLFLTQSSLTTFSKLSDFLPSSGFNICSIIDIMADVFLGIKFCSSHILYFLSCLLYISLYLSFFLDCLSCFYAVSFLKHFFTFHDFPDTLLNHPQTSYEYSLHLSLLVAPYGILWILGVVYILGFQIYKNQQANSYHLGGNHT